MSAGFAPGPLLTLVVAQTLKHDTREGVRVAVAPLITDLPIIVAALLILSRLTHFRYLLGGISFFGGMYVLYLAYESLQTEPVVLDIPCGAPHSFRKGALINALNPHPYLFWTTVGAPLMLQAWPDNRFSPLVFMASFYIFLVGSKLFLVFLVGRSRTFLMSRGYLWIMRLLGVFLGLSAVVLMRGALVFWGLWGVPN